MAENDWAERRRRMVKCKTHGLHYDPEMSTGCTLCLRDTAKAQPSRSPQPVLILLCLLGMAAILFYLFGPGREAPADNIDLGVASNPSAVTRLDPEPFRAPIEALELALFRTPIDQPSDLLIVSSDVQTAAEDLTTALLETEPVNGLTAADLIARMGQAVPSDQVTAIDIERARAQWTSIRRDRFQSADWFTDPADGGDEPTDILADYSAAASNLRTLVEDAASETEALSEQIVPGEDPALAWRTFARDWLEELDRFERRLPNRPDAGASSELLIALQDLEQAIGLARTLASSAQAPSASDDRFEAAIGAALRAQQGFDDLAP